MIKAIATWIKRIVLLLWLLFLLMVVLKFYFDNPGQVSITFWRWTAAEVSLPILVFGLISVGMAIALLALIPWMLVTRIKLRRVKSKLVESQTALKAASQTQQALSSKPVLGSKKTLERDASRVTALQDQSPKAASA